MPPNPPRRRTTRPVEFSIIIPRVLARLDRFKVEIVDQDGTVTDVTTRRGNVRFSEVDIKDGGGHVMIVTLAHNEREFLNSDGTPRWTGGEELKVYQDFEKDTLTDTDLLFRGKMNHPKFYLDQGGTNTVVLVARKLPEIQDRRASFNFPSGTTHFDAATIVLNEFSDLIDLTTFNANLSGETSTIVASKEDTFMNMLSFIFEDAGWSGFFDNPADGNKFLLDAFVDDGSERNDDVVAAIGGDLLEISEFGSETDDVATRVDVKGQQSGGSSILWQARDDALESDLWRKDLSVNDNAVTDRPEAIARSSAELVLATNLPTEGFVNMMGDKRLHPGQYFQVRSPNTGVNGYFKASKVDHNFDNAYNMIVQISRRKTRSVVRTIVKQDGLIGDLSTFDNFNDMKFSVNFTFDDDTDITTKDNVTFSDGRIKTGPLSEGSFTSIIINLPNNITSTDMKLENPVEISDSTLEVSNDGGATFIKIAITNENLLHNFTSTGSQLRIRMVLTGATTSLDGLTVRVK